MTSSLTAPYALVGEANPSQGPHQVGLTPVGGETPAPTKAKPIEVLVEPLPVSQPAKPVVLETAPRAGFTTALEPLKNATK